MLLALQGPLLRAHPAALALAARSGRPALQRALAAAPALPGEGQRGAAPARSAAPTSLRHPTLRGAASLLLPNPWPSPNGIATCSKAFPSGDLTQL